MERRSDEATGDDLRVVAVQVRQVSTGNGMMLDLRRVSEGSMRPLFHLPLETFVPQETLRARGIFGSSGF